MSACVRVWGAQVKNLPIALCHACMCDCVWYVYCVHSSNLFVVCFFGESIGEHPKQIKYKIKRKEREKCTNRLMKHRSHHMHLHRHTHGNWVRSKHRPGSARKREKHVEKNETLDKERGWARERKSAYLVDAWREKQTSSNSMRHPKNESTLST